MTIVLDRLLQWCFTTCMEIITRRRTRESIEEKAERILADPARVIASPNADPPHWWTGRVVGDHGTYAAFAVAPEMMVKLGLTTPKMGRMGCLTCKASAKGKRCSHMRVAEKMRLRGEG